MPRGRATADPSGAGWTLPIYASPDAGRPCGCGWPHPRQDAATDSRRTAQGAERVLDRKRKATNAELDQALDDYGTHLLSVDGIERIGAATIIAIVGDVRRFLTQDHFASFNGTSPIAAPSGEVVHYRLNLGGRRQVNKVLHTAARVQTKMEGPGWTYLQRRTAEGKTTAEATRSLKRQISNAAFGALRADVVAHEVAGEEDNRATQVRPKSTETLKPGNRFKSRTPSPYAPSSPTSPGTGPRRCVSNPHPPPRLTESRVRLDAEARTRQCPRVTAARRPVLGRPSVSYARSAVGEVDP